MRTLTVAAQNLLDRIAAGEIIPMVQLVRVDTTPTMYLTTAGIALAWGGHTWQPVGLQIEPISDTATGEIDQLVFTLPAVTEDQIANGLTEDVAGVSVRVFDALVDPATGAVADAKQAWAGALSVPTLQYGAEATLSWTAEHRAARALRAKPSRYTNDEQRRLYPGDTSLDIDPQTDAKPLAWPAASFFKQ
jgi:hypothetical protein